MSSKKSPPPDTVGNLKGRIGALRLRAKGTAQTETPEGSDSQKELDRVWSSLAPELKKLKSRLKRVESGKAPAPSQEKNPVKKTSHVRVPKDYDDLLDTLKNL